MYSTVTMLQIKLYTLGLHKHDFTDQAKKKERKQQKLHCSIKYEQHFSGS